MGRCSARPSSLAPRGAQGDATGGEGRQPSFCTSEASTVRSCRPEVAAAPATARCSDHRPLGNRSGPSAFGRSHSPRIRPALDENASLAATERVFAGIEAPVAPVGREEDGTASTLPAAATVRWARRRIAIDRPETGPSGPLAGGGGAGEAPLRCIRCNEDYVLQVCEVHGLIMGGAAGVAVSAGCAGGRCAKARRGSVRTAGATVHPTDLVCAGGRVPGLAPPLDPAPHEARGATCHARSVRPAHYGHLERIRSARVHHRLR